MNQDEPISGRFAAPCLPAPQSSPRQAERKAARRRAFIAAARKVFQKKGFAATTIDDIIVLTGGSRGTLYVHFHSKLALFEAVVRQEAEQFAQNIAHLIAQASDYDADTVAERLIAVASSKETISLLRTVIVEREHYPGIGEIYREIVPGYQIWMRRVFRADRGPLAGQEEAQCDFLADMFLAIVLSDTQMAILTGLSDGDDAQSRLGLTRERLRALLALRDQIGTVHPRFGIPKATSKIRVEKEHDIEK